MYPTKENKKSLRYAPQEPTILEIPNSSSTRGLEKVWEFHPGSKEEKVIRDNKINIPRKPWMINSDSKKSWLSFKREIETACSADFLVACAFFATCWDSFCVLYRLFIGWSNFQQ